MGTLTKKDVIDRVADLTKLKRNDVRDITHALLELMISELGAGNRLEFRDFGVFEIKARKARRAQNPRTLEPVKVPPKHTVKFKPGRIMREHLDRLSHELADGQGTTQQEAVAPRLKGLLGPAGSNGRVNVNGNTLNHARLT